MKYIQAPSRRRRTSSSVNKLAFVLAISPLLGGISSAYAQAYGQEAPTALADGSQCSVEMVPMRDGVKLFSEVYRPSKPGKYPVIYVRTPYTDSPGVKGCSVLPRYEPNIPEMAAHGYAVVLQESRGTSRSEGQFRPFVQEAKDGYDAVEWAARQPWSTGKVGMMGGSYLGIVQWQAANARPPHLVTIVPSSAPTNGDQGIPFSNGVFNQALAQDWATGGTGASNLHRKLVAEGASPERMKTELAAFRNRARRAELRRPTEVLPFGSDPVFNNDTLPWYNEWVNHPMGDQYWSNFHTNFETLSLPVLSFGAFYDQFGVGSVAGYTGMHERAKTPEARSNARLVMAGGGHVGGANARLVMVEGGNPADPNHFIGDITFGADNEPPGDLTLRWFDYWLKGIKNGVMDEPAVKLYVMLPPDQGSQGSGFWLNSSSFPVPGTKIVPYYLGGEDANTSAGGGTLALNPAATSGSDRYRYDPANPVPSIGGAWCCGGLPVGAMDQRPVEIRPDVLVYTTEPLKEAVPVIGEATVSLAASSTAPSTAFTAKLVDVHLDGYAQIIADGIVETAAREANSPATYTIKMNATGTVFKPGHRIRLEISSSNYPRFRAHTNTTEPLATAKEMAVATQTIWWKGTSLNLPVAPISVPK